jgi:hypothetical protein
MHNTILTIQEATCFGSTRQPLPGFTYQKYKKGNNLAVAIHTAVKTYRQVLTLTQKYLQMSHF